MFAKNLIMTIFSVVSLYCFVLAVLFSLKSDVNIFTMSFVVVILMFVAYALFPFKSGGPGTSRPNVPDYKDLRLDIKKLPKRKKK